jgi:hypothetical protein
MIFIMFLSHFYQFQHLGKAKKPSIGGCFACCFACCFSVLQSAVVQVLPGEWHTPGTVVGFGRQHLVQAQVTGFKFQGAGGHVQAPYPVGAFAHQGHGLVALGF